MMVEDFPLAIHHIKGVYDRKRVIISTEPHKSDVSEINEESTIVHLLTE